VEWLCQGHCSTCDYLRLLMWSRRFWEHCIEQWHWEQYIER